MVAWLMMVMTGCGAAVSVDYQDDDSFAVTAVDFSGYRQVDFLAGVAHDRALDECYGEADELSELPCDLDEPSTCFSALYVCSEIYVGAPAEPGVDAGA